MPAAIEVLDAAEIQGRRQARTVPEALKELPCYCGCGAMGHTSNYACYVAGVDDAGELRYDPHALGCSICVDITQDAMRLLNDGQGLSDVRAYVDRTYARYGRSNMP